MIQVPSRSLIERKPAMTESVLFLLGLIAGGGIAWFIASSRSSGTVSELREQISQLRTGMNGKETDVQSLQQQLRSEGEQKVAAQTELRQVRLALEEERKLLDAAEQKLKDAFKALADDALRSNSQTFLSIAKGELETVRAQTTGDLESRKQEIKTLVTPLEESLQQYRQQIQAIEGERKEAYGGLRQQLVQLQEVTRALDAILRTPQQRGQWGQIHMERLVELAGMTKHCDFAVQESIQTERGMFRPDMTIMLPRERRIPVDSKVPIDGYRKAIEAMTDQERNEGLTQHARLVRGRVDELAPKRYWERSEPTVEIVVLYLPAESLFRAAVEQDINLIEYAIEKNVFLASPITLIALLRSIALGWKQEELTQNALQIQGLGKQLYERTQKFVEHYNNLGSALKQAVESYRSASGSLESRLLVSARRFRELGVATGEKIPPLVEVEADPRLLQQTNSNDEK